MAFEPRLIEKIKEHFAPEKKIDSLEKFQEAKKA